MTKRLKSLLVVGLAFGLCSCAVAPALPMIAIKGSIGAISAIGAGAKAVATAAAGAGAGAASNAQAASASTLDKPETSETQSEPAEKRKHSTSSSMQPGYWAAPSSHRSSRQSSSSDGPSQCVQGPGYSACQKTGVASTAAVIAGAIVVHALLNDDGEQVASVCELQCDDTLVSVTCPMPQQPICECGETPRALCASPQAKPAIEPQNPTTDAQESAFKS